MLTEPSRKYQAFPPIVLKDRTWPDVVLTKAQPTEVGPKPPID